MTTFFITPYKPTDDPTKWEDLKSKSDLRIDPDNYKDQMQKRWSEVEFFSTLQKIPLQWVLHVKDEVSGGITGNIGKLHSNLQIVSFDTPFEEFILWHRSVISEEHELYLFNDSSWDSLKLEIDTSLEEIKSFVGGQTN